MKLFGIELGKRTETVSNETLRKAKTKANMSPIGVTGLAQASGKIEEEFLDALQWPDAGAVYLEMSSNDAVVGACIYLIETLVRQAEWEVKPASQDAGDVEAADFVTSCMHDMAEQSWDDFLCEALSMLIYGFSFHEIVYKTRRGPLEKDLKFKSNYTDGKIGWQEFPGRSQMTLNDWIMDESTGRPIAFQQDPSLVGSPGEVKDIPITGNLLFRTTSARNNPEGYSILRRAYRSWYFKRYIEELEGIGIERNLAGIPLLSPPEDLPLFDPDNEDMVAMLTWAQSLVDGLRQDRNHGIVLPPGWKLELLGTSGSANSALKTDEIIRRHENRMAMAMLADVVMMGGDRTGSFALAETKQGLLLQSIKTICNRIASVLNTHAVPALFAVNNWTVEKLPKIQLKAVQEVTLKDVALILRSVKLDITRDRELFNFLMGIIQAPELDEERFNALLGVQGESAEGAPTDAATGDIVDPDNVDNDFKQQGDQYGGMGET